MKGSKVNNESSSINDSVGTDAYIDQLLTEIEGGQVPLHLIVSRLLELLIKLDEKERQLDSLIKSFPQLSDISRKVSEIHTLHFATKELKRKTQKDRFMAQILLGPTRKMLAQ